MVNRVAFQEDESLNPQLAPENQPKMVQWVLKLKLAKTEKQASYVLFGIAIAILLIALGIFMVTTSNVDVPSSPDVT